MSTLIERLRLAVRDMGDIAPERWTDAGRAARVCVALDEAIEGLRAACKGEDLNCSVATLDTLRAMLGEETA